MNTFPRRILFAGALAVVALLLAPRISRSQAKACGYSLEVKIGPMGEKQFQCEATVKDLASGEVVSAPHLQVLAGKSNVASTGDKSGKHDVTFSVSIEGEAKEARYTLEVSEGETVIASQKAAVKLR